MEIDMGFIRKADEKFIDSLDKVTTKIQRKGILPLNTIIMGNTVLFWATILKSINFLNLDVNDYLVLLVAPAMLWVAYLTWLDAAGYWESHRKTMRLNAIVTLQREQIGFRWLITLGFIPILLILIVSQHIVSAIGIIALILIDPLKCCRYIGPGEYDKERKAKLQGLPETS